MNEWKVVQLLQQSKKGILWIMRNFMHPFIAMIFKSFSHLLWDFLKDLWFCCFCCYFISKWIKYPSMILCSLHYNKLIIFILLLITDGDSEKTKCIDRPTTTLPRCWTPTTSSTSCWTCKASYNARTKCNYRGE